MPFVQEAVASLVLALGEATMRLRRVTPLSVNGSNSVGIECLGTAAFDGSNVAGWRRELFAGSALSLA